MVNASSRAHQWVQQMRHSMPRPSLDEYLDPVLGGGNGKVSRRHIERTFGPMFSMPSLQIPVLGEITLICWSILKE